MTQKHKSKDGCKARKQPPHGEHPIHSDVLGSYTGMGEHGDPPEQDADDL